MRLSGLIALTAAVALLAVGPAAADWNTGDYDKMHWPQLPDPEGYDVAFFGWVEEPNGGAILLNGDGGGGEGFYTANRLADDWGCSETGPVTDIHFWVSMKGDQTPGGPGAPVPFTVEFVAAMVYGNIPAGPEGYSIPDLGDLKWWDDFDETEVSVRWWSEGPQDWYDPLSEEWIVGDHLNTYQVNITDITDPWVQTEGEIYWLELHVDAYVEIEGEPLYVDLGWKTSGSQQFMDDAVFWYEDPEGMATGYRELTDPADPMKSLDLAFVITPEPATVAFLVFGGVGGLARMAYRRRRRPRAGN